MVFEVGSHPVAAADEQFRARQGTPEVASSSFTLHGPVVANPDPVDGAAVEVESLQDLSGAAFYRITPMALGANHWLTLELPVEVGALRDLDQLIPTLDAAAPSSMSVFALLRLELADGRHADGSSMEVELRRGRKSYSFPVSLDDLPAAAVATAESARVMFFVEARDVHLDYFGLRLFGVERVLAATDDAAVERVRTVARSESSDVAVRRLETSVLRRPATHMTSQREFGPSVFVDADHANGGPWCRRTLGGVVFDFTTARKCRWRNFEFRFSDVASSPTLSAMIALDGRATGEGAWTSLPVLVRNYGTDGAWEDSRVIGTLDISGENDRHTTVVDVTPALRDDRDLHTVGLMVFVPETCRKIHVSGFETFLYDRVSGFPTGAGA